MTLLQRLCAPFSFTVVVAIEFMVAPAAAQPAADKNWIAGTGNWNVPGNWSHGVPTGGDAVNIVFTDGIARTVTYDVSAPALGLLTIDLTGPGASASTLSMASNHSLTAAAIIVGGYSGITGLPTSGRGALTQSAGTTTISSGVDLGLGYGTGSSGTYTLSGGALVASQNEFIGLSGAGTFNHSGGTNSLITPNWFLVLGTNSNSTGTYNL
jgi:hypothetical protein